MSDDNEVPRGLPPAVRALLLMRRSPELLESCARNLRGSRNARIPARKRDRRSWAELTDLEREMWRRRTLHEQAEFAKRRNDGPDDDPDGDGEPMPELRAA